MPRLPQRLSTAINRRSEASDVTLPAILEFQWPSTAIINAPVPRSSRWTTWIITAMVATLIAIFAAMPIDRVVTASGIVVSQAPTIVVQPLETAIVRSINVREGQFVRAGDVLAELNSTFSGADVGALKAQVSALMAEVSRLDAENKGETFGYIGSDASLTLQATIFGHRAAEFALKVEYYNQKIEELLGLVARSRLDAAGYRERLSTAKNLEKLRQDLEKKQIGTRINTLAANDNRAEMGRALGNAELTAEVSERDLAARISERDGYIHTWRAEVSQRLAEVRRRLNDAREELAKATLRRQLVDLRADRDATVMSVAKVSVGSVLQSGQHFVTLVPANAPLEIEANIPGHSHGYVHLGDTVSIKFKTFPFTQHGSADGKVQVISPNSFTAQEEQRNPTSAVPHAISAIEPFYRARISIDRIGLRNVPHGFNLLPGMLVSADIKVGERTVLDYLLGAVLPVVREGMREP